MASELHELLPKVSDQPLVERLSLELAHTLQGFMAEVARLPTDAGLAEPTPDRQQILPLLAQLLPLLQSGDLLAAEVAARHKGVLLKSLGDAGTRLLALIEQFDYEMAAHQLEQISLQLQSPPA